MSDASYPDHWRAYTATGPASGINPSIAVPAIPNVSHVLTDVIASATWSAGAGIQAPAIGVYANPSGVLQKWLIFTSVGGANSGGNQFPWSGKLLLPPNTGFTVAWQIGVANVFMWLELAGYMV